MARLFVFVDFLFFLPASAENVSKESARAPSASTKRSEPEDARRRRERLLALHLDGKPRVFERLFRRQSLLGTPLQYLSHEIDE